MEMENIDESVVEDFGAEWTRFDQSELDEAELQKIWESYFAVFPWDDLPTDPVGLDVGCGSGRWARFTAPHVGKLICIDPSSAVEVARRNLSELDNCEVLQASVDTMPVEDGTMDFAYSLGVLHHVPDTALAVKKCVQKLKPGAPFLLYLYYRFDNRPRWFRAVWWASDILRRATCRLPGSAKTLVADGIAVSVYLPLSRLSATLEQQGMDVSNIPLSAYRDKSFYTLRTDALDRFGTRLEQRFERSEIEEMMRAAGLEKIRFSDESPYWCASGYRKSD